MRVIELAVVLTVHGNKSQFHPIKPFMYPPKNLLASVEGGDVLDSSCLGSKCFIVLRKIPMVGEIPMVVGEIPMVVEDTGTVQR